MNAKAVGCEAAFNPAGTVLATGGAGIELWNPFTRALTATIHTPGVSTLAFNSAGTILATAQENGLVRLWDPATRKQIGTVDGT